MREEVRGEVYTHTQREKEREIERYRDFVCVGVYVCIVQCGWV